MMVSVERCIGHEVKFRSKGHTAKSGYQKNNKLAGSYFVWQNNFNDARHVRDNAGLRQRCMYCLDSHGSDIEHFRPKAPYPKSMYQWTNLLLCCTHCGRLTGNQFPLAGRSALLVDPTKENPWDSLDFDPTTGNISARFNATLNAWSVPRWPVQIPRPVATPNSPRQDTPIMTIQSSWRYAPPPS